MSSTQLIRCTVAGQTKWRPLIRLDHSTLCAQFGLDEHRVVFDLPRSAFEAVGSGQARREGRTIDGYVLDARTREPIGTIHYAYDGERFRDDDPTDRRAQLRLG